MPDLKDEPEVTIAPRTERLIRQLARDEIDRKEKGLPIKPVPDKEQSE